MPRASPDQQLAIANSPASSIGSPWNFAQFRRSLALIVSPVARGFKGNQFRGANGNSLAHNSLASRSFRNACHCGLFRYFW